MYAFYVCGHRSTRRPHSSTRDVHRRRAVTHRHRAHGRGGDGLRVRASRHVEIASRSRRARAGRAPIVCGKSARAVARVRVRVRIRVVVAHEQQQQTDGVMPRSRFVRAHVQVDASRTRDCVAVRRGAGGARRVERAVSRRATRARAV